MRIKNLSALPLTTFFIRDLYNTKRYWRRYNKNMKFSINHLNLFNFLLKKKKKSQFMQINLAKKIYLKYYIAPQLYRWVVVLSQFAYTKVFKFFKKEAQNAFFILQLKIKKIKKIINNGF